MTVLMTSELVNDRTLRLPRAVDRNGCAAHGEAGFANNKHTTDGFSTAIAMSRLGDPAPDTNAMPGTVLLNLQLFF